MTSHYFRAMGVTQKQPQLPLKAAVNFSTTIQANKELQ